MALPATLGETHELHARGPVTVLVRRDWAGAFPLERLLAGVPLEQCGEPVPHGLAGRARVHVLATPRGEVVAKQLTRGGMLGALCRRTYLDRWRPAREAALAEQLRARGQATPPVVLVRSTRVAPGCHRLELATERVPGVDLAAAWSDGGRARLLVAVGRTLRRLHDAGLRHRDLNVKNLLVPSAPAPGEALVVLDLDRARLGPALDAAARVAALARLGRSACKLGLLRGPVGRAALAVRPLAAAYGAAGGVSAPRLLTTAARRLARRLPWHRRRWSAPPRER